MKRYFATVAAATLMLAAPGAALAVGVSSNDGSGSQYINQWYGCGASTYGSLRSTSGNAVYYAGRQMFNNTTDSDVGRYTTNTTSSSLVNKGGQVGPTSTCAYSSSFTGIKVRICRDRSGLPDGCGSEAELRK